METVLIFAFGILVTIILTYFLGISIAPYKPNKVKNDHFECGLPPSSEVPQKANFGFFIFAIAFIIVDMGGLFFSIFAYSESAEQLRTASMFGLIIFLALSIAMYQLKQESEIIK